MTSRSSRFVVVATAAMLAVSAWADSPPTSITPPNPDLGVQLLGTSSQAALQSVHNQSAAPVIVNAIQVEGAAGDFTITGTVLTDNTS